MKAKMNEQRVIQLKLELPSDIFLALNEDEYELKKDIKISYAIRLYHLQKLTLGKSAQLAGLSRFEFETILSENHIPISNLSLEDVLEDSKKLK